MLASTSVGAPIAKPSAPPATATPVMNFATTTWPSPPRPLRPVRSAPDERPAPSERPASDETAPPAPDQSVLKTGGQVYADECAGCHGGDGKGEANLVPALSNSAAVQQSDATSLLRAVLRGARNVGTASAPTTPAMPAFAWVLNDDQVADVLTYIRNSFGNAGTSVSTDEAGKARRLFVERSD